MLYHVAFWGLVLLLGLFRSINRKKGYGDISDCDCLFLSDVSNIDLKTSLNFQPWGNDTRVFKANIMSTFNVEIFHHLVVLHTFWRGVIQTIFTLMIFMYEQFVGVYWKMSMSNLSSFRSFFKIIELQLLVL